MYSYRDPECDRTVEAFNGAVSRALEGFSKEIIQEDLLSAFSSLDRPTPPSRKGLGEFIYGITNEMRQTYRSRLLEVCDCFPHTFIAHHLLLHLLCRLLFN